MFVAGPTGKPAKVAAAAPAKLQPLKTKTVEAKQVAAAKAAPAKIALAPVATAKSSKVEPAKVAKLEPAPAPKVSQSPAKANVDPQPTASLPPKAEPAAAPSADANPEFRWPARGRIIQGFKSGGNDGINISVPEGTPVKAAENGVVAYAGSELKGYGNLVLIRHPNGFVSAYANNGELDVKRGDTVRRGQTIAKSGQSGNVATPQLHFELRKGSTPVDPDQLPRGPLTPRQASLPIPRDNEREGSGGGSEEGPAACLFLGLAHSRRERRQVFSCTAMIAGSGRQSTVISWIKPALVDAPIIHAVQFVRTDCDAEERRRMFRRPA